MPPLKAESILEQFVWELIFFSNIFMQIPSIWFTSVYIL